MLFLLCWEQRANQRQSNRHFSVSLQCTTSILRKKLVPRKGEISYPRINRIITILIIKFFVENRDQRKLLLWIGTTSLHRWPAWTFWTAFSGAYVVLQSICYWPCFLLFLGQAYSGDFSLKYESVFESSSRSYCELIKGCKYCGNCCSWESCNGVSSVNYSSF